MRIANKKAGNIFPAFLCSKGGLSDFNQAVFLFAL